MYSKEGILKFSHILLLPLLIIFLAIFACDNNNSGGGTDSEGLPNNPNDWVCPGTNITLSQREIDNWCADNADRGIPAPPAFRNPPSLDDFAAKNTFDEKYREFIRDRRYANELDWNRDLNWRMTGPYVGAIGFGEFFGVHSAAVRIYYSPEVVEWLCGGRVGAIPDGAMIIKEQHPINESLGIVTDDRGCMDIPVDVEPTSWTTYVKNNSASFDGWYQGSVRAAPTGNPVPEWQIGNPTIMDASAVTSPDFFANTGNPPFERDPNWYPTGYLFLDDEKLPDTVWTYNQYGNWCINCHASATSESTFSSLDNIITPGAQFLQFSPDLLLLDNINFEGDVHIPQRVALEFLASQNTQGFEVPFIDPLSEPTDEFLEFYDQIPPVDFETAWETRLPAETYDHQVSFEDGPPQFLTSDQCIGCHDATFFNLFLPNMIFEEINPDDTSTFYNLSPYAEWKASPLGQAGRDPIFFAQVEGETNFFSGSNITDSNGIVIDKDSLALCVQNTCLHCHGVMGQRQFQIDTEGQDNENCNDLFGIPQLPEIPVGAPLSADAVTQWPGANNTDLQRYGSLARDGISCTVCHHIADEGFGTENIYTGNFITGPPNEIYGPFREVVEQPMRNSLGINPQFGSQIKDPNLCGTCHNILLPILTNQGELLGFSYEQTTDLEWQNSVYAPGRSKFETCQGCHMPNTFHGEKLEFKIANIEDDQLPPSPNRLPDSEIRLRERSEYARHSLHGLNVFLNEMFQEFPLILGTRQIDFMSGVATELPLITARESFLEMARNQTANVEILSTEATPEGQLKVTVKVTNKAGHYLPSGVNFRRVFLELLVNGSEGNVLWASGRTNSIGAIIEGVNGPVLPTELVLENPQAFQPHYQKITAENQVQIYQEVVADSDGDITTSFLRRVFTIKNNRIRPEGFDPAFFFESSSAFVRELAEIPGDAKFDPYYTDPNLTGADIIEYIVTLDPATMAAVDNVSATLYNQSIPPFFLQQRFNDANVGPAEKENIERLYYLTSHLNTQNVTDNSGEKFIEDWKLMLGTDTETIQ